MAVKLSLDREGLGVRLAVDMGRGVVVEVGEVQVVEEDEERFGSPTYTKHSGDLQAPNVRKYLETASTPRGAAVKRQHHIMFISETFTPISRYQRKFFGSPEIIHI
jgi:hypothetical protein